MLSQLLSKKEIMLSHLGRVMSKFRNSLGQVDI